MKLESLKLEKFNELKKDKLIDAKLISILGGRRMRMSSYKTGGSVLSTDTADLTCGGASHDGRPGDGISDDWTNITWSQLTVLPNYTDPNTGLNVFDGADQNVISNIRNNSVNQNNNSLKSDSDI